MDKIMYQSISTRLSQLVPDLNWIDFDYGQLNAAEPGIAFPACLIDISYPSCEDVSHTDPTVQRIDARISLRLAFKCYAESSMKTPENIRMEAIRHMDVLDAVHTALQGWSGENVYRLSRLQATPERRSDGIKAYHIIYRNVVVMKPYPIHSQEAEGAINP